MPSALNCGALGHRSKPGGQLARRAVGHVDEQQRVVRRLGVGRQRLPDADQRGAVGGEARRRRRRPAGRRRARRVSPVGGLGQHEPGPAPGRAVGHLLGAGQQPAVGGEREVLAGAVRRGGVGRQVAQLDGPRPRGRAPPRAAARPRTGAARRGRGRGPSTAPDRPRAGPRRPRRPCASCAAPRRPRRRSRRASSAADTTTSPVSGGDRERRRSRRAGSARAGPRRRRAGRLHSAGFGSPSSVAPGSGRAEVNSSEPSGRPGGRGLAGGAAGQPPGRPLAGGIDLPQRRLPLLLLRVQRLHRDREPRAVGGQGQPPIRGSATKSASRRTGWGRAGVGLLGRADGLAHLSASAHGSSVGPPR